MDVLLSAVASDLVGRLFSFLIGKYRERGATDTADRLQRALLRARIVIEEAEGRQIASRAMLQQLSQLKRELCRATYAIDTQLSRRVGRSRSHVIRDCRPDLVPPVMVESLEAALNATRELVLLLGGCPRITRQPYNTYLFMERCMFGGQMEKEHIISFLCAQPGQADLDVLPIIGPHEVGKRTLVEHVWLDERVRQRFAKIYRLRSNHLDDFHIHDPSLVDFTTARSLIVIDIDDQDTDAEESWRRFHSAFRRHRAYACRGSKIIISSTKEAHSSMGGTVPPLRLRAPRQEDLWYFFRALAFGAVDPDEHPELARIAMALCAGISRGCTLFAMANAIATSLCTDLSMRSWRRVLKVFSETKIMYLSADDDGAYEDKAGHYNLFRPMKGAPGVPCLFYNRRKFTSVVRNDLLPKVTTLGLLTGSSLPPAGETRFDVLVWQSRIPPYASYVATCDTDRAHHQHVMALFKKQRLNKRRRDHQDEESEVTHRWLLAD